MALKDSIKALGNEVHTGDFVADVLTAERVNGVRGAILALIAGQNISSGPGILISRTPLGITIKSTAVGGGDGEKYIPPFTCAVTAGKLTITPGFVNNIVPTINDVKLDADPTPTLAVTSGINYVYLKTDGSFNPLTGVETVKPATIILSPGELKDVATLSLWTAYDLLTVATLQYNDDGILYSPTKLPSYRMMHVKAANFGSVNAYYT